ncbi:MAG: glucose-6-phosphate dehydrogenase [Phycisphaeraceae bacterium]
MNGNGTLPSCLLVIFGASGDLTKRKLVPALYHLFLTDQLPAQFAVLGISRSKMSDEEFREHLVEWARKNEHYSDEKWQDFARRLHYHAGDSTKGQDFDGIKSAICQVREKHQTGANVLYYLSLAPQLYESTIVNLGAHDMVTEGKAWCSIDRTTRSWQRIIIEKPFGSDPESAAHLNRVLGRVFEEESIYRIDHYLGKETVQNLLVFRFANTIFDPIWNRNFVDHVQVTAAETMGVEGRGGYYDSPSGGAMRDMIQSHLLQLMAVVAMEPPVTMSAAGIRTEKLKVLQAVRPVNVRELWRLAVRGQYGPGSVAGKAVPGYREEEGVGANSQTDTYAALELYIDSWRWGGVPFYVRSGKRMARKLTEIVVSFKKTPHRLFGTDGSFGESGGGGANPTVPNQIVINVQPDEGIRLRFEGKVPGNPGGHPGGQIPGGMNIKSVVMDFDYKKQFKAEPPEAYATLLLDAIRGDQTLFKHRDEIEVAWNIVQPVLDTWKASPTEDLPNYAAGTWGPSEADVMMAREGRLWHK